MLQLFRLQRKSQTHTYETQSRALSFLINYFHVGAFFTQVLASLTFTLNIECCLHSDAVTTWKCSSDDVDRQLEAPFNPVNVFVAL